MSRKVGSHFADFRQVKKISSHFNDFEQVKNLVVTYLSKHFLVYAHIFGVAVLKCIFWGSNFEVYPYSEIHFLREQLF